MASQAGSGLESADRLNSLSEAAASAHRRQAAGERVACLLVRLRCRVIVGWGHHLRVVTLVGAAVAVVTLAGSAGAAPPASAISYGYDELGRLAAVSDPANGAAKYGYDAAGNLTSITRQAVTVVSQT